MITKTKHERHLGKGSDHVVTDGQGNTITSRVSGSGSQVGSSVEVTIVNGDGVTKQTVDEKGHVLEIGANGKVSEYNVWDEGHNRVTPQRPLGEDEPE